MIVHGSSDTVRSQDGYPPTANSAPASLRRSAAISTQSAMLSARSVSSSSGVAPSSAVRLLSFAVSLPLQQVMTSRETGRVMPT